MNFALLDCDFNIKGVKNVGFLSDNSLLDYDVIIWDPSKTIKDLSLKDTINKERLDAIIFLIKRRKNEIYKILNSSGSLFVFIPENQFIHNKIINPISFTIMDDYFDLLNKIIDMPGKINIKGGTGSNIIFSGYKIYNQFWKSNEGLFQYQGYLTEKIGTPFLYIQKEHGIVGSHIKKEPGNIFLLPKILFKDQILLIPKKREGKTTLEEKLVFISSIELLLNDLSSEYVIPEWANNIMLPGEKEELTKLDNNKEELVKIETQVKQQEELVKAISRHKILFTGTGTNYENEVNFIFNELGFIPIEKKDVDCDGAFEYDDDIFIIESKGVNKSASKVHVRQLVEWINKFARIMEEETQKESDPKGLLIINTFRNTPLIERKEASFPDNVIEYAQEQKICLMTGLQLLILYCEFKNNKITLEELIKEIIDTKGVFKLYQDWQNYLSINR
jgi:hypothetical protein